MSVGATRTVPERWLLVAVLCALGLGCMGPAPAHDGSVGRGAHAWPLVDITYDRSGRATDILWPLFAFNNKTDHKYYAVRPLAMVKTDAQDRITSVDALFPFFHVGTTGTRDEFAMRPLFGLWRDPTNQLTDIDVLFPFGHYRSEPGKTWLQVRPLFWYKDCGYKGYCHVFPFYGENWSPQSQRTWLLTPLITWGSGETPNGSRWDVSVCYPLAHFGAENDTRTSWIMPLYLWSVGPRERTLAVTPLFWHHVRYAGDNDAEAAARTLLLLPFYGYVRGGARWHFILGNVLVLKQSEGSGSVNVGWPLFHHGWTGDGTLTWLFPLFVYHQDPRSSALIVPPFVHTWTPHVRNLFLWPLFGYHRRDDYREYSTVWPFFRWGSDGENHTNLMIGGPLFSYKTRTENERSVDFLWPFGQYSRDFSSMHTRFFPFFLYWDDGAYSQWLHILWPLVRYAERANGTSFRLLFPYVTYDEDVDSHDFRVFWKWIRSSQDKDLSVFYFNPFYYEEESAGGDTYWSVLGGLVARKCTGDAASWTLLWGISL